MTQYDHLQLELEHQVHQEALLAVLEYPHLLQGVQVHMDCNLSLKYLFLT